QSLAMRLDVQLPADGREPVKIVAPGGHEIRVRQVGVEGQGELANRAVVYKRAGGTSFWTVTTGGAEEWLHLEAGAVTSDLDVAAAWEIEGAKPVLMDGMVALMDDAGVARGWVTAPEAYGAEGRPVDLRLDVVGQRIELFADAAGEEVLLDPGWAAVAPVTTGRFGAAVATLSDGRVLLAGGTTNTTTFPTTTQLYNATTNVWSAGPALSAGRYGPGFAVLTSGQVLVAGGQGTSGYLTTAEKFDPATNAWTATGVMGAGRNFAIMGALLNGDALFTGGFNGTSYLNTTQIYNGATNTWSNGPNMLSARGLATGVVLQNGKVLAIGGLSGTPMAAGFANPTAEVYDPATGMWTATSAMVSLRYSAVAKVLADGRVLVSGGFGVGGALAGAEIYNPTTNSWVGTSSRSLAVGRQGAVLLGDGRVLAAGGNNGTAARAESEIFDPTTETWAYSGDLAIARENVGAVTLVGGDALIVSGGSATNVGLTNVDRYVAASLSAGSACTINLQCASNFCVNNICCTVSACPTPDQCHLAGTCQAGTGVCSNPSKPDGTTCTDGNACTATDTCQAGSCVSGNAVVCMAQDQCHVPGVCNTTSGICTNPIKPNMTACNDNNACTQTDACQNGTCVGTNPLTCTASDQCHVAGTCDPMTGVCSNPNKVNGAI
ncbi:MAG TPA: hypothetical protein PK156_50395, partial [Polyangium sp.]|nr:hypothetical protein [Polyangium sp.]